MTNLFFSIYGLLSLCLYVALLLLEACSTGIVHTVRTVKCLVCRLGIIPYRTGIEILCLSPDDPLFFACSHFPSMTAESCFFRFELDQKTLCQSSLADRR